jgi:phage shock protein E
MTAAPKILCALTFAVAAACSRSEPTQPPGSAPTQHAAPATPVAKDPEKARALIDKGAVVVDVRSPDEFAGGHLPSAVNIPVDELPSRLAEVEKLVAGDKAKPIVVYCAAGGRAAVAKTALDDAGYGVVVNGGGYKDLQPKP